MNRDEAKLAFKEAAKALNEATKKADDLESELERVVLERDRALTRFIVVSESCRNAGVTKEEIDVILAEMKS